MGKFGKIDKKKLKDFKKPATEHEVPLQKIISVPKPKEVKDSFDYFVKKISGKTFKMENFEFTISLVGEPSDLTANFQLIGLIRAAFIFTVKFEIGESIVDVYYYYKITTEQPILKANLVMSGNMYQNNLLPIVSKTINKAITHEKKEHKEEKEKKPKEEKEKKPKEEKEKKPKEEKEKKPKDPLKLLKLKFVEGEISEEEYVRKKKLLEE
jgi:hypothetical protein